IETYKNIIDKYNIPAKYIELELTESIIFDNFDILIDIMNNLNTRIDTENEKQNIKIDQLIAGGSNVASTQIITIDDWVEDAE
ncbi:phage tail protein, partial [Clostridioides difficile]